MKTISFVIPVYRNADSLPFLFTDLKKVVDFFSGKYLFELVFVDDYSDDDCLEQLKIFKHEVDATVPILSLANNFGQVAAVAAGLDIASGDAIIIISADLQDPLELAIEMIDRWEQNNGVVVAYRAQREDGLFAALVSRIFYQMMRVDYPKMPLGGFDYCLIDKQVNTRLPGNGKRNRFLQGEILSLSGPISFVPYTRRKRKLGKSQHTLTWRIRFLVDAVMNSSFWLTTLLVGLVVLAMFAISTVFILGKLIIGQALIILGLFSLIIALAGEYLRKVLNDRSKTPAYVIRSKF